MRRLLLVLSPLTLAVLFAVPAAPALASTGQHAAITITSNAGFSTCGCVTRGSGTAARSLRHRALGHRCPERGNQRLVGEDRQLPQQDHRLLQHLRDLLHLQRHQHHRSHHLAGRREDGHHHLGQQRQSHRRQRPEHGDRARRLVAHLDRRGLLQQGQRDRGLPQRVHGVSINNSKFKATCDICTPHTGDGIYAVNSANLQSAQERTARPTARATTSPTTTGSVSGW